MLSFASDYIEGAHPKILEKLAETNFDIQPGYGDDAYCLAAKEKIRAACGCPEAEVYFLMGGTQTNRTVISAYLRDVEGVVSPVTGHVNGHEGGAIESSGHKVLTLPTEDGRLDPAVLRSYLRSFYSDAEGAIHMVQPGMVYVTHPTEYGTIYTFRELEEIRAVCDEYDLPLFLDGARLGYGLATPGTDVTLSDIARLTDVFYIGGTKVGALLGEAVVFPKGAPKHFFTHMKQNGAVLAKGRVLGIQFGTLFTDGLYESIARHAVTQAERIRKTLSECGFRLHIDAPTNQVFVVLTDAQMEELGKRVVFTFWEKPDEEHSVIRLCTSWATRPEAVDELCAILCDLSGYEG
ncbi:MAG: low specificity L-threonine aldolase [Ruminococcaceae bacterium]|jgi:threonine aldolase|nr:low specificity L-threonine aldolase [Oscillospiraceae bacterium]